MSDDEININELEKQKESKNEKELFKYKPTVPLLLRVSDDKMQMLISGDIRG